MFEFYYNFRNCIRKKIMMTQYDFLRFLVCKFIFPIVFFTIWDWLPRQALQKKLREDWEWLAEYFRSGRESRFRLSSKPRFDFEKKNESHSKTTKTNINALSILFCKMNEIFTQLVSWKKANYLSDLNRWKIYNHDSL